ncbi:MAG: HD domain-containing protein [Bacteroidales bacterium]|nr:HD domain-containing protein [Bacteroidales bacterium]MBN2697940.1 HD domain-containing protein [Bacteroidales bacterium]
MSGYSRTNKQKIINDPIYGFIKVPSDLVFDLIEHPYFQRLRRIRQLGMTYYVYPGANHTRFQHALGAMHLMGQATDIIRSKGHHITEEEAEAVTIAILLHDIGHGPFSHSLEHSLIKGLSHEELSLMYMELLNDSFKGKLAMAISIFRNHYSKRFLHQLVSGQLDMDRLDYLKRDSFFTGVTEGVIGSDRIIKMLNVLEDNLVVDEKGIYSIEKFLIARRLMFWQVYLHKSVLSADQLLVNLLRRAHYLSLGGEALFASPALQFFLNSHAGYSQGGQQAVFLEHFADLDDSDILSAAKVWAKHTDPVLSLLCRSFINRELFAIELQNEIFQEDRIDELRKRVSLQLNIPVEDAAYLVSSQGISNYIYTDLDDRIKILKKDGRILDIAEASDMLNISLLSKTIRKYFLWYPKFMKDLF